MTPGKPVAASTRTVGQPVPTPDAPPPQSEGARLMAEAEELALLAKAAITREMARAELMQADFMKARNDRAEAAAAAKAVTATSPRSFARRPRFG